MRTKLLIKEGREKKSKTKTATIVTQSNSIQGKTHTQTYFQVDFDHFRVLSENRFYLVQTFQCEQPHRNSNIFPHSVDVSVSVLANIEQAPTYACPNRNKNAHLIAYGWK